MSQLTLDDVASLLVQLEPTDLVELARVRDALTDLAFENRVPLRAQPFVARAARVLGAIVSGALLDAAAGMTEVHGAIDEATRACDGLPARAAAEKPAAAAVMATPVAASAAAPAPAPAPDNGDERLPDDADRELLPDFIMESGECVTSSEAALLQLEENPDDEEAVNTVFRAFHTVKGTSAFLGLARVAAFAHEAESLLSRVRDREIAYTRGCADLALRSVDMLNQLLAVVESALNGDGRLPVPHGYFELVAALSGYDAARDGAGVNPVPATASAASASAAPAGAAGAAGAARTPRADGGPSAAEGTIRVRTDRLDRLIDMVGELVISQSMIAGDDTIDPSQQYELVRKVTHAGKIVRELQDLSMSMRMVPLRPVFQKLARVVRDTAVKAGKTVQFVTDGEDIEIDRNLVDILGDPLVHMVRNSVDHGVEPSADREANGKDRTGRVRLSAYHASGNVVVELSDDGRGLHRDKLVAKAIEKGLIESDKGMSDAEVFALIFAPGFSTAEKITDISGRGVGMDVVRRNLESIRGRIDIASQPGKGTTFSIRLPLTLAVTDGMIVRVGEERFVVPLTHIHMSFRPEPGMLSTVVGRGEAVLLRGELMPIIRLHRLFDVAGAVESPLEGLLMIVGDGDRRTALLVDDLLGQQQVVAKSLGQALGKVPGVSGGAILGDGRVGLILDVNETVALAQSHDTAPLRRDRDRLRDVAA